MNNQQLYLAIGLPTLTSLITLTLVCLAWLSGRASDRELRREIHQEMRELRMDIDKRFDAVDRRFDAVDHRFDAVDHRFDVIERRFDPIDAALRYFHGITGGHEARLNLLEKK